MDVSQYLEIFIDETKEHLQNLSDQLMVLEQEPENMDVINEIFRAAHSLKGMAGTMGFKRMQRLTHDMENVFQEIRSENMKVESELIDVLFRALDALEAYLNEIMETANEGTEENEEIVNTLNAIAAKATGKEVPEQAAKAPEGGKEETSADSGDGEGEAKYQSISISDFEKHTFEKAQNDNQNIFGITVSLQESCILKAARAFLVFKALEELGEVIKAVPSVQDIEDEKFEMDFSLLYFTKESLETVKNAIESVSEVKHAVVGIYTLPDLHTSDSAVEKPETKVEEPEVKEPVAKAPVAAQQAVKKQGAKPAQKTAQKNAQQKTAKPTVGRTVRVDIEKLDVLMNLVSELIIAKMVLYQPVLLMKNPG